MNTPSLSAGRVIQALAITTAATAALLMAANVHAANLTKDNGAPVGDNQHSQTAGADGPVLLQDVHLIQKLQRFDRERIPERVVHARGTAAHGEFVVTGDISKYTKAKVFQPGTKTPVFTRFSSVIHGLHSVETARDPRGFAVKFYTQDGNWDLVGNNLPVFFIRDAIKFPDVIHSLKPSPDTNLQDANRIFDFMSNVPESTHMLTRLFSDFGTPANYREMDGNGVHAFKLVNDKSEVVYVKFHWDSKQGERNLSVPEAEKIQGKDFSHMTRDLLAAIDSGNYPKWDLKVQILEPKDFAKFDFDPLDTTKIWPGIPEVMVGTMTLNRNPKNVFQETEQSAFAPGNLVPGIEASEDKMLQGRLFSYNDTQLYRVGTNVFQLPINAPKVATNSNNQDGEGNSGARSGKVNYEPSSLEPKPQPDYARSSSLPVSGTTVQMRRPGKQLNFRQAGEFYRSLGKPDQANLISNLGGELSQVKDMNTRLVMLSYFYKADADYGTALAKAAGADVAGVKAKAATLSE